MQSVWPEPTSQVVRSGQSTDPAPDAAAPARRSGAAEHRSVQKVGPVEKVRQARRVTSWVGSVEEVRLGGHDPVVERLEAEPPRNGRPDLPVGDASLLGVDEHGCARRLSQ